MEPDRPPLQGPEQQPKFCRCHACHRHFYGETLAQARESCRRHALAEHREWGERACYCPDY